MTILQDISAEQAELVRLRAENAALKAKAAKQATARLGIRLGPEKGEGNNRTVHVTGINGKYGVALYREQWTALLALKEDIQEFILDNSAALGDNVR